jgi:NADPH:quinone reductase-like Zn-dependent oxidoreductase
VREWVGGNEERKFDLVVDAVGEKSVQLDGWEAVKRTGRYVSLSPWFGAPPEGMEARFESVTAKGFIMDSRGDELAAIGRFLARGIVRVRVDSVWGLDEFEEAFRRTGTGHAKGKVVLKIGDGE